MVIVFSGGGTAGHFHPARNVADALVKLRPSVRPYFVGAEGRIEARELPRSGHPHRLIPVAGLTHPFRSGSPLRALAANLRAVALMLLAVCRLVPDFRRREARAVVLTGGYVCVPAGIAARVLGLPVVLQEQNTHPGKATRLIARWAAQIHVAHPEAGAGLPGRVRPRVRNTGNPIRALPSRSSLDRAAARLALGLPADAQVVLVVGGSQGALGINRATLDLLKRRLPREGVAVLWITGPAHYDKARAGLGGGAAEGDDGGIAPHKVVRYLEPARMYQALAAADLAISRAGAMATSEFLAWELPAILVPLPTAAADHQTANARALAAAGAAALVPERDADGRELDGATLWQRAEELLRSPDSLARMARAAADRARPNAARSIAAAVAEVVP